VVGAGAEADGRRIPERRVVVTAAFDHLVWAVPDLAAGVAEFAERTGVQPAPGGRHDGFGTANHLVALSGPIGAGGYLEIIGPDPEQPGFAGDRPFGVDPGRAPRLATWAARVSEIESVVAAASTRGFDPGGVRAMARATPSGARLEWRLTPPDARFGGVVPFLIDWGDTPHPASAGLPSVELVAFRASHPDPAAVRGALEAIGATLPVDEGPAGLTAEFATPGGPLTLGP
jgi:hypothetical protein